MTRLVKTVAQFETSDELRWDNKQVAETHQLELDIAEAFKKKQAGKPGGMAYRVFMDFLSENRLLIGSYLDNLPNEE